MKTRFFGAMLTKLLVVHGNSAAAQTAEPAAPPPDVKPGSITCEDAPYPYPTSYFALTRYGQDMRMRTSMSSSMP